MKSIVFAAALSLVGQLATAQNGPQGLWATIDDETKAARSLVRVSEAGGVLSAVVEKGLDPAKAGAKCDKCTDERKDQAIVGMTILRNVKKNSSDAELWDGGEILDPTNGKVYKVRLKPIEGGQKLEVRGYIGLPMLGRTQVWQRVE